MCFMSPWEFLNSDGKCVFSVWLIVVIPYVYWGEGKGWVFVPYVLHKYMDFFLRCKKKELGFGRKRK